MKREFLIPFVLCSLTFVFLIKTLDEPGLTWDEANFIPSSISYLNWFQILGDDIRHGNLSHALSPDVITNYWRGTSEHPPLSKLLSALAIFLFHGTFDLIFAARISTVFIFLMLILLVYKFTCEVGGKTAGCFSALSLLIMPRVFGHAHLAFLDICMAFMWFLTVFSFVKGIHSRRWSVCTGIVYGLALAAKLNAILLPIPLLVWGHLYHRKESRGIWRQCFLFPL